VATRKDRNASQAAFRSVGRAKSTEQAGIPAGFLLAALQENRIRYKDYLIYISTEPWVGYRFNPKAQILN